MAREGGEGSGVDLAEDGEAEAQEARVAEGVAGDAVEGFGPDVELPEFVVARGEDGDRAWRQ